MKKVFLIACLSVLVLVACINREKKDLPDFNLLLADSATILKTGDIPKGKPIIFIFFSPDCEHCQAETVDILKHMDLLKNTRFYFATIDPFERLKVFKKYFNLDKYPNIILGRDYQFFLPKYFEIGYPPYTAIYNKNKGLEIVFDGEIKAADLIKELNKQ